LIKLKKQKRLLCAYLLSYSIIAHCETHKRSNATGTAIPSCAGTTPASRSPGPRGRAGAGTDSGPTTLGIKHRQLTLYMFAAAFVTSHRLVCFVEGTQDFVFFLAVETNIFVDWHNVPSSYIINEGRVIEQC
jgi:hypothetical protein